MERSPARSGGRKVVWGATMAVCGLLGLLALVVLPVGPATQVGRPSGGQVASPPDPGAPGAYAVGVSRRSLMRSSSTTGEPRTLDVVIWYPATPAAAALTLAERLGVPLDAAPEQAGRPYPLLLFSPGAGGEPDISTFFTTHLASHGFVVVATSHPGTTPAPCPSARCAPLSTGDPVAQAWAVEAVANRSDDVRFVLETVLELSARGDPQLGALVDGERVGMTGTSYGGGTALDVVADDPRFRAVVPLAPAPMLALPAAPRISAPTMLVVGEADHLVQLPAMQELYAALAAGTPERWFVRLPRAGHGMLTDWCPDGYPECDAAGWPLPHALPLPEAHARINRWATAFLLRYVAGDARYAPLLDPAVAAGDPDLRVTVARAP